MIDDEKLHETFRTTQRLAEQHQGISAVARRLAEEPAIRMAISAQDSVVNSLMIDAERHDAAVRAALAPLDELRRAGVFDQTSELFEQFRPAQELLDAFNARFTLPEMPAAVALMQEWQLSPAAEAMERYTSPDHEILRAMEAMHTPWLDAQDTLRSVSGFVEMQGIGRMLERMPSFDESVCADLRHCLGDWRDPITWTDPLLTDWVARDAFYLDLGFDPCLTDFPAPAFRRSIEIAGLRREPPPLVVAYGEPIARAEDEEDEQALVRTNMAHDWLQRLESNLRQFIDARMTAVFGSDWPKRQLPNGLYEQWVQRRESVRRAGRRPMPLIAYADFTDYERVICKQDNWRQVFQSCFLRQESVRESFQRLHLIRLDTMHARPIIQEDELLLYIEVTRLVKVIDS